MSRLAVAVIVPCALGARAASLEVRVRDSAGEPVADAAVYAVPVAARVPEARGKTVTIEQVDREFVPYLTVMQAGTSAIFPNRDPIMHHVYSFSPAKRFEIKLYSGNAPSAIVFDKPGVVTLGCNIHDWMVGFVLVVPTSHFAKTGAGGVASLRDLPPGSYSVHAWHPRQRTEVPPFTVALDAASAEAAEVTLDPAPRKAKFKPPLDRLKY
ncbi:MAG: methylamine utilization protein [Usitatibacter sp.]